jgi:prepilin-type processing-associated H-X9-DG protein
MEKSADKISEAFGNALFVDGHRGGSNPPAS